LQKMSNDKCEVEAKKWAYKLLEKFEKFFITIKNIKNLKQFLLNFTSTGIQFFVS